MVFANSLKKKVFKTIFCLVAKRAETSAILVPNTHARGVVFVVRFEKKSGQGSKNAYKTWRFSPVLKNQEIHFF